MSAQSKLIGTFPILNLSRQACIKLLAILLCFPLFYKSSVPPNMKIGDGNPHKDSTFIFRISDWSQASFYVYMSTNLGAPVLIFIQKLLQQESLFPGNNDFVRWNPLDSIGVILLIGGASLRLWSYKCLGKYFDYQVTIHEDHKIIRNGPYRVLRHPSYTGYMLARCGYFLFLRKAFTELVSKQHKNKILVMISLYYAWICEGFLKRIMLEEHVMRGEFGELYDKYKKETWRLVPYIF
ncbi:putative protein-S-isoprenylcysteine O-methyltransferase [Neolecta irregularis DAH-3]|uniref:Protein-S-isoprenylcysteine O-methyltransferase n=1 Tax=Neolecta irregularis (strain DAH-3) TaxID=1198029 RepID=A0A1U7LQ36_NEOID|nr:putative protein-S-isoprenylcysteine O-methyltransferase [Neolecta irregularis DAH-3]|eukprot:OLL24738.1 putative protein-S-isoprenylcysteine O-methyltransferase [Neolecta irregularis DAH-3]